MAISLGLFDLVETTIGESPPTFTREGVSSTLDYMLGTQNILEPVSKV